MTFPASPDTELLDRYLANDCSPDERTAVEAWMIASPGAALRMAALRRAVAEPFGPVAFTTPTTVRRQVWRSVDAAEREKPALTLIANRSHRWRVWGALAGTAFGVMILIAGWYWNGFQEHRHGSAAVSTYTTGNGQRANITLPDGSTVVLDVASRLDVPVDYLAGDRMLRLSGEALFTVAHQSGGSFIVLAGPARVRVLGTSFLVRHYTTDTTTLVAVHDGKVAVRSLVVTPNREVEVWSMGIGDVRTTDPGAFSFATGVLTLNGESLRAAIPELDRWYNADIRLGDPSLETRQIAGGFTAGSLADLSELLELTFNVRVVRDERVLTLFPKG